jgi:hypothetical protein
MKALTQEQIEENKAERLANNNKRGLIRRNTWGIEQNLSSKPYAVPGVEGVSDKMTKMDIAEKSVKQAILKIKLIKKAAKDLDSLLEKIEPKDIVAICTELGVDIDLEEILSKKEISDKFKWDIIFNLDKAGQ